MSWLDRQSFLGEKSDEVLAAVTVGLVGLGGGGSHVAQQLAHVGVGGFVLADHDAISLTNLNRLVGGTMADVERGSPKVVIAERTIRTVNPAARVEKHQEHWQTAGDALKECDVIIGGVDSVRAKDELEGFCRRFLIPYIDMGMDVHHLGKSRYLVAGQVALSSPGTPCLRCLGIVTEDSLAREAAAYGDAGGTPQVVWPNGLLASVAVGLFVQLITPWHSDHSAGALLEYDANRNILKPAEHYIARSRIPCPHHKPEDVGEPSFDVRTAVRDRLQSLQSGEPVAW